MFVVVSALESEEGSFQYSSNKGTFCFLEGERDRVNESGDACV